MFTGQGRSSSSTTLRNYGKMLRALELTDSNYIVINSREWKKVFPELETDEIAKLRLDGANKSYLNQFALLLRKKLNLWLKKQQ